MAPACPSACTITKGFWGTRRAGRREVLSSGLGDVTNDEGGEPVLESSFRPLREELTISVDDQGESLHSLEGAGIDGWLCDRWLWKRATCSEYLVLKDLR